MTLVTKYGCNWLVSVISDDFGYKGNQSQTVTKVIRIFQGKDNNNNATKVFETPVDGSTNGCRKVCRVSTAITPLDCSVCVVGASIGRGIIIAPAAVGVIFRLNQQVDDKDTTR